MHSGTVLPRVFIDAAVAQSLARRIVRFGPTTPVVPAAARVWQLPHVPTPVKIVLPAAAALPPAAVVEVDELGAGAPPAEPLGTPGCAALGGGTPSGGGPFAFCERSQLLKAAGVTTWTVARIREWPAPHSSVHSA